MKRAVRWAVAPALTLSLMAAAVTASAARSSSVRLKTSKHAGVVKVHVGSKDIVYYKATRITPAVYKITGPARVRLLARDLAPGAEPSELRVQIGLSVAKVLPLKKSPSKTATVGAGGPVGALSKVTFEVPPGPQTVKIYPTAAAGAAVRMYRGTSRGAATKWVSLAPDGFERTLRIQGKDSEQTCYRFTQEKPVTLSIRGPMRLKVSTRIDFGTANGYTQSYVVKALLDRKPWKSFSLSSRASHTMTYPEMPDVAPGMGREILLEVPGGPHVVWLELDGTTAAGATASVRVPEKELKATNGR
jgi:hypothetical protein